MAEIAISILMPVYNVAPYLRAALDTVFRQTWQDFELLIVDDGSTDGTRAMLGELRDPRPVRLGSRRRQQARDEPVQPRAAPGIQLAEPATEPALERRASVERVGPVPEARIPE